MRGQGNMCEINTEVKIKRKKGTTFRKDEWRMGEIMGVGMMERIYSKPPKQILKDIFQKF